MWLSPSSGEVMIANPSPRRFKHFVVSIFYTRLVSRALVLVVHSSTWFSPDLLINLFNFSRMIEGG